MKKQLRFLVILLWICLANQLFAQKEQAFKEGEILKIETTEGNKLMGTFKSQDNEYIVLESESVGTISLKKTKIKKIKRVSSSSIVNGEYWFENPNRTPK